MATSNATMTVTTDAPQAELDALKARFEEVDQQLHAALVSAYREMRRASSDRRGITSAYYLGVVQMYSIYTGKPPTRVETELFRDEG